MSDCYETLRAYLDEISACGCPKTESGVELRILKKLFTEEEAKADIFLRPLPEPIEVIAERMGKTPESIQPLIDQMVEHCLIRAIPKETGGGFDYHAIPFAPGLLELSVKRADEQYARDYVQYRDEAFGPGMATAGFAIGRTIPVGQSVVSGKQVIAYERIEEIIQEGARPRAVQECWCRVIEEKAGGKCKKHVTKEVCVSFGPFARNLIDSGQAREIDDTEFRRIMEISNEAGLIPQVALNTSSLKDVVNVCNCCNCCCGVISSMIKCHHSDFMGGQAPSSYVATVEEDSCTRCEECYDRCQTDALVPQDNGVPTVMHGRCLGCGLCTTVCDTEAITLDRRPEEDIPPVPESIPELFEQVFLAKNTKAGQPG